MQARSQTQGMPGWTENFSKTSENVQSPSSITVPRYYLKPKKSKLVPNLLVPPCTAPRDVDQMFSTYKV